MSDAIDRTVANPTASHCWLNLMSLMYSVSDREIVKAAVDLVRSRVPNEGLSGFFRAMYLDIVSREAEHIAEAGRILMSMQPMDVDRMAAFHYVCWQRALTSSKSREEFVGALRHGCLPAISRLIGQAIAKNKPDCIQFRPVNHVGKIAVIAPYLTSQRHPPTLMATDQAAILAHNGIEVNLFSCQEAVGPEFFHLLGNGLNSLPEAVDLNEWLASVGHKVKIHTSDHRFSLMRRGVDMLKNIAEFDPDLIMFVGLHSCLAWTLYDVRPVLSLGINSAPSMVPADVWLTAQTEFGNQVTGHWSPEFPESLAWHHSYRIRRKPYSAPSSRTALNIATDSVVLITAGNTLPIKITGAWATQMSAVLRNNPGVIWLLVGGQAELPETLKDVHQDQLRLMSHSPEISSIFACCDIYINPPNMGGGFSVAEAMAEGIPVLTYAGSDGGDKAGDEAVQDDAEYFDKLDALIKNIDLRIETGKRMRERFDRSIDLANSGPGLMAACNAALKRYQQRIHLSSI
ncbi:MAG: glycosyltransferase [Methylobacter sp.]